MTGSEVSSHLKGLAQRVRELSARIEELPNTACSDIRAAVDGGSGAGQATKGIVDDMRELETDMLCLAEDAEDRKGQRP